MRVKKDREFLSVFDEKTGAYVRTGILDPKGKDTGEDAFMSSYPELLDVGIMGHCAHGKTGLCLRAGIECYQNGLYSDEKNMRLSDFELIAQQCEGRTFQFALGGCGDPDQHESFIEILRTCRKHGIAVSFTTSGYGMTEVLAAACKQYCGAVAVSWYRSEYTLRAIDMLLNAGVKTNIHYVLSSKSISEAYTRILNHSFPLGINAIVFLLHKPVGMGKRENVINVDNKEFDSFLRTACEKNHPYKIGFDACTIPAIIDQELDVDSHYIDTCEAGRWSAYITPDMKMLPCSFDAPSQRWAVDLSKNSIETAWNGEVFSTFRSSFQDACPTCKKRKQCMGGCPILPEIVLCRNKRSIHRCGLKNKRPRSMTGV